MIVIALADLPRILTPRRPIASLARFSRLRDNGFTVEQSAALSNGGYDIDDGVLFKPGDAR